MKVLFIGDIVGSPGREALRKIIPRLKAEKGFDWVIANAENAAGGSGINAKVVQELFLLGCDCLTSGDHIWKRPEVMDVIDNPAVLRPANLAPNIPGKGYCILVKSGVKIGVINLQGRVFMPPIDCPFRAARDIVSLIKKETDIIFVDMHAEATSEKVAMGHFLDGKVTAVVGTHTHIQTADEKILPFGSAYITDLGMTGPCDSVIGRDKAKVIEKFLTGMPTRFDMAKDDVRLQGAIVEFDSPSGRALSIERVQEKVDV